MTQTPAPDPTLDLLDAIADVTAELAAGERLHGESPDGAQLQLRLSAGGDIILRCSGGDGATVDYLYGPPSGWLAQDAQGVACSPEGEELTRLAAAVRAVPAWQSG